MLKIPLPNNPKIIKEEGSRAVFEIEPCYPGYGLTLGNAFRRVLLSSLPGAAITSFKIKGVSHEFSTLPHVLEDAVEIMLNLKQIRFRVFTDKPVKLSLKEKGEKEVKASSIKTTADVEVVNKDALIATLTDKKADFDMEIVVERGLGYVPVEQAKKEKLEIGMIALDAIFTPIKKVNYEISNIRVGERTDYNRLLLDIETDGSITPKEAFEKVAEVLVEQFGTFTHPERKKKKKVAKKKEEKKAVKKRKAGHTAPKTPISGLKLSKRTLNVLEAHGIKTVAGLRKKKEDDLMKLGGIGKKGVKEIKKELGKLGIILRQEGENK